MKILIIGKPTYNVIMPLANFLVEGTKNKLPEKLEMGGGATFYAASLLAKWGMQRVHYTGVVGSDIYGNKIKDDLKERGVDIRYLETNYENPTAMNYIIVNGANGSSTQIIKETEIELVKYKYDFVPDYIIMDGTDMAGSLAAANNFPKAVTILLANQVSKEIHALSKKVSYVIANVSFAQALTKMKIEIGKAKQLVAFYQKIKDLNKSEYVVMLREHGVLYSSERQVKMIPAINIEKKIDDTNAGYIFFSAFCYGLINDYGVDSSVKMANVAAGLSLTKMGTINCIPTLEEVLQLGSIVKPEAKAEEGTEVGPVAPAVPEEPTSETPLEEQPSTEMPVASEEVASAFEQPPQIEAAAGVTMNQADAPTPDAMQAEQPPITVEAPVETTPVAQEAATPEVSSETISPEVNAFSSEPLPVANPAPEIVLPPAEAATETVAPEQATTPVPPTGTGNIFD